MVRQYPDGPLTANLPPNAPPNDPPPPSGDPEPPTDGPTVPDQPSPPVVDIDVPSIDIDLPDVPINLPEIDISLPDVLPDVLADVLDGIGVEIDASGDGDGGLLGLVGGDGLNLLGANSDTDALINLDAPIGAEGSVGVGGDGGLVNLDVDDGPVDLGGDGGLLNLGGLGDGLALMAFDGETDALVNADMSDLQGSGGADLGSLINAAMLDIGGAGAIGNLLHGDAYDGNVPLVGDLSSALGATLDHITTSASLFDVPALDVLGLDALDS